MNRPLWLLVVVLGVVLFLPGYAALSRSGVAVNVLAVILSALSLAGLLTVFALELGRCSRVSGVVLFAFLVSVVLFVRLSHALLVDFSGHGFTDEVFFHFEPESFRVGWQDYKVLLSGVVGLLLLLVVGSGIVLVRAVRRPLGGLWLLVFLFAGVFYASRSASSEYLLFSAYRSYVERSQPLTMDHAMLTRFSDLQLIHPAVKRKSGIKVKEPQHPRNLILVYLESFNSGLTEVSKYPDLTPSLNRLQKRYGFVENYYTSGFVTIEGIINSQCGTLADMSMGSNSFMGDESRMIELPCLGDVLQQAGYRQIYLGGAPVEFAGKGNFLSAHGFDEIRGYEYWQKQGFSQRPGKWGLSDAELFDQALLSLDQLRKNPPYNLTLLTIGTHLPGYSYRECEPYTGPAGTDSFLDAIHCTDALLGSFVDRLESGGYLDEDTTLVITADHGVFPTPKMRELFGEMVDDRRLVTIVAGGDFPRNVPMAAYDLAPSLLDFLGIDHDTSFVFGTSVYAPGHPTDNFLTRYGDIIGGRFQENNPVRCGDIDPAFLPTLPLDPCGKRLLMSAVAAYQRQFSAQDNSEGDICQEARPYSAVIPEEESQPVAVWFKGQAQEGKYSKEGWFVNPGRKGAYLLDAGRSGGDLNRRFYDFSSSSEQQMLLRDIGKIEQGRFVSLILRLDEGMQPQAEVLTWLKETTGNFNDQQWRHAALAGFTPLSSDHLISMEELESSGLTLELDSPTCVRLTTN
ncbi:MAG: LTA synthase family protein [Proteobacteria bacterium]|nr:LTA synthase family protein [Pseudomonadota bacterium]MBU1687797.1 LTA synthase family protein [Pseudomonadota bacterium]